MSLQRYKKYAIKNKKARLWFLRSLKTGRPCKKCRTHLKPLEKTRQLVCRSGYCPKCGFVENFKGPTTTLDKLWEKNPEDYVIFKKKLNKPQLELW